MSQNSLSLFDDAPEVVPGRPRSPRATRTAEQQHLLAARRLARRMARFADQSPEQLEAGREICRHLVAMLKESADAARPH